MNISSEGNNKLIESVEGIEVDGQNASPSLVKGKRYIKQLFSVESNSLVAAQKGVGYERWGTPYCISST